MKKILWLLPAFFLLSCANNATTEREIELNFSDEMLFEGANTLQMQTGITPASLAKQMNLAEDDLKSVGVKSAEIQIDAAQEKMVESLLLQVVSNNNDMISIGTLSPVNGAGTKTLSIAEDLDLMPYLKDEGCTWVLDVNLAVEDMTDLELNGSITLNVEHSTQN